MHINNNSGTYKPTAQQGEAARSYLSDVFGVAGVAHAV